MNTIEFFVSDDGMDICYRDGDKYAVLTDKDVDIIAHIYNMVQDTYPDAHKAMLQIYGSNIKFKWLTVRRFIKCNLSKHDEIVDIEHGIFNLERIKCPLRGECKHEHIICMPRPTGKLSTRELEVAKLIADGLHDSEIADALFISQFTAENHRKNILKKLSLKNKAGIAAWYKSQL